MTQEQGTYSPMIFATPGATSAKDGDRFAKTVCDQIATKNSNDMSMN